MVAARSAWDPRTLAACDTGAQIIGIELVEACAPDAQLRRGGGGRQLLGAKGCEDLTDERRSEPVNELLIVFFMARKRPQTRSDGEAHPRATLLRRPSATLRSAYAASARGVFTFARKLLSTFARKVFTFARNATLQSFRGGGSV
jgi:hypothetical protein